MTPAGKRSQAVPFEVELLRGTRWHRPLRRARALAYLAFFGALAVASVQLHVLAERNRRKGADKDRAFLRVQETYRREPTAANRAAAVAAAREVVGAKRRKGAIPRWAEAVRQFWQGRNIYRQVTGRRTADPLTGAPPAGPAPPAEPEPDIQAAPGQLADRDAWLHPNMPFVVILLTPLAYLPLQVMLAVVNVMKIVAIVVSLFAVAAVTNHRGARMGEWVLALAAAFVLTLLVSDIQHGNTNCFVLALLAVHLWLYRRGRDGWAGAALALAICLKMTPALFAVYWLYQRNWRLGGVLVAALAVMVVGVPLAVLGWGRFDVMMGGWLTNLIVPGLLRDVPYPIHINQSLSGVFCRLFMGGNIYFAPDDAAAAEKFRYVSLVRLAPAAARPILTAIKLGVVGVMAWCIGWRKLPRRDGRRGLHYGMVVSAMLILNQRTWDHHGAILLIAYAPIWYALAYGLCGRGRRIACLVATIAAGVLVWGMSKSLFPTDELADVVEAYGPTFLHFAIVFAVCAVLARALARAGERPYAERRIPLSRPRAG